MPRKHKIDLPVILRDTGEHGIITQYLASQGGVNRYRITVEGRQAVPGRPQGETYDREIEEALIGVGMTPEQKTIADDRLRAITVRPLSTSARNQLKAANLQIRNNHNSTDHQISEAIRVLEAIEIVKNE